MKGYTMEMGGVLLKELLLEMGGVLLKKRSSWE
jgi:hypothetical protein